MYGRNKLLAILLLMLFLSVNGSAVVDFGDNARYSAIKEKYGLSKHPVKNYMVESEIHVLGWSKKNLFAYVVHEANEARDFEKARLTVQDIVTDKVITGFSWNFETEKGFQRSIDDHFDEISKLLQRFKIDSRNYLVDSNTVTLPKRFPIVYRGHTISTKRVDRYESSSGFLKEFELLLQKGRGDKVVGEKTVFKKKYSIDDRVFDLFVLGYIPSPYTDRIAIVLARVSRGWEGAPHVMDFEIVGASLSKAFRKVR